MLLFHIPSCLGIVTLFIVAVCAEDGVDMKKNNTEEPPKRNPGKAPILLLNNGDPIPAFGLGTWLGIDEKTGMLEPVIDDSVEKAVEIAIDAGYRLIDTAQVYDTEGQIGRAIKKKIAEGVVRREDLFIVTKLWSFYHAREKVVPSLKASLQKLDLEYIDLFLMHFPIGLNEDFSLNDIDYLETWEGLIEAQALNLTKAIGVSNFNLQQLQRLRDNSSVKPAALQNEVHLNLQEPQLLAYCREQNILPMAYTPFGALFKAKPDAPPPRSDHKDLVAIAEKHNKTVGQIALRYLFELGTVPIPKSVTKKRIEENIDIFDFHLKKEDREVLGAFDKRYRVLDITKWKDSPFYPYGEY